jgi:hypothetical protein
MTIRRLREQSGQIQQEKLAMASRITSDRVFIVCLVMMPFATHINLCFLLSGFQASFYALTYIFIEKPVARWSRLSKIMM